MRLICIALALSAGVAVPATAEEDAGSYLAARSAMIASDYREASQYFARALVRDPSNLALLENAVTAYIGLGDLDRAAAIATRARDVGSEGQLPALVLLGHRARDGEWEALLSGLDDGLTVGPLFDGLARAWALVGTGEMSRALEAFDQVASNQGVESFGLYHKALALWSQFQKMALNLSQTQST